jgi:predicted nucleic acid-binding Zn ribbon protein
METLTEERICKDCGKPLGPGREDKQYCDDACRTNFNNQKQREARKSEAVAPDQQMPVPEYIARIQEIILANRALLESLCDEENAGHIRLRHLVGRGFNVKFFTSEAEPTGSGNVYRFCFEYGYCEGSDGIATVVCRKREIY